MGASQARWSTFATGAMLVVTGLAYVLAYRNHPNVRLHPTLPSWWAWTDQGRYLRAAQAWAAGDLDPAQHWYPAGYPLLGAAFLWLMPGQPFYVIDLVCLLATGVLTVALATRLVPGAWTGPMAALAFCLAVPLDALQINSYVEPWTTTQTAPLTLLALLLALDLWQQPSAKRAAATGLTAGALTLFRPMDMVPLLIAIGLTSAIALRPLMRRRRAELALAALAGLALPCALATAAHLAVFGFARGAYLTSSAATGFEWRLLSFNWVTIMVSAAPDLPNAVSLSQAFPVIVSGLIGMIACLIATDGQYRRQHAMVIGAVWLHILLFLSYRDLHAQGLFRFMNYHYFKWCGPVFALYTWFLLGVVARSPRRWLAWGVGGAVVAAAFFWRVSWQFGPPAPAILTDHTLAIAEAPRRVGAGLFVPASGSFESIYLDDQHLRIGDRIFDVNQDFKLFPIEGGLVLAPLRPLPDGPATLLVNDGVHLLGPPRPGSVRYAWHWPLIGAGERRP